MNRLWTRRHRERGSTAGRRGDRARVTGASLTLAVTLLGHCGRGCLTVLEVAAAIQSTCHFLLLLVNRRPVLLTRPSFTRRLHPQPELSARPGCSSSGWTDDGRRHLMTTTPTRDPESTAQENAREGISDGTRANKFVLTSHCREFDEGEQSQSLGQPSLSTWCASTHTTAEDRHLSR